ncbi:hypothetical protein C2I18_05230 [Paenibacillus sp. PK3_47]|uniref:hypothetical protein n=1 Tax=Paenibacillus sp. PK3_47 TaxID=2072642 RepID=UPI00201E633A|nr:hypothetical protein [Paenibacillus sp. PK3_47]UQZ33020.1 hypothetical protein C2I18_05230 [Paenibacillus sp. PK3_47]
MSKRIQAYFRTEDEAEGARVSLIPYGVSDSEVSALTDPLDADGRSTRNFILPLIPYNNSAMTGGAYGVAGATGTLSGAPIVPPINVGDRVDDPEARSAGDVREGTEPLLGGNDEDDLHYVMDLKVEDASFNEIVEVLRGKHAYVEVFD